ncbi:MAG: hypothetical protein QM817_08710 [Archangium sp.]
MKRLFLLAPMLLWSACPTPVSLECATCGSDAECAPQGLTCRAGRCASDSSRCEGTDAGSGGGTTGGGSTGGGSTGGGGGATGGGGGGGGVMPMLPALGVVPDASVLAEDDFEGDVLVGDGGHWDILERAGMVPGQTLNIVPDAGLAGSRGLVIVDTSTTNPQFGLVTVKNFPEQQGTFFVRAWIRLVSTGTPASVAIAIYAPQVSLTVAAEFSVFDEATLKSGEIGSSDQCPTTAAWDPAVLHLVELQLTNVGLTNGRAEFKLDGVTVCSHARNWNGAGIDTLAVGPSYNDPAWQGRVQVDAFAMTRDAPPPGKLVLVAPTPLIAGCLPARVELHDTVDGGLARAVRPTRLDLSVPVFTAPDCSGASVSQVTIATGQPAATFFLQATQGSNVIQARDRASDLLPAMATWPVP